MDTNKYDLLLADAIPELKINIEFDKIQTGYQKSKLCAGTTVTKLKDYLDKYKPNILHISAHGSDVGELLFAENDSIEKNELANFLTSYTNHLQLVVLNACNSDTIAEKITKLTGITAIGFYEEIDDDNAISWAENFYKEVKIGKNYYEAYLKAKKTWTANNNKGIPRFYFKNEFQWNKKTWLTRLEAFADNNDLQKITTDFKIKAEPSKDDYIETVYAKLYNRSSLFDLRNKLDRETSYKQKYPDFENNLIVELISEEDTAEEIKAVSFETVKESFGNIFKRFWLTIIGKLTIYTKYEEALKQLHLFTPKEIETKIKTFKKYIPLTYSSPGINSDEKYRFDQNFLNELIRADEKQKFSLLLGGSGSGKSTLMQLLFAQLATQKNSKNVLYRSCTDDLLPIFKLDEKQKENTILFLDSFDEAPEAYGDSNLFFTKIETYTQKYASVIIACRLQFFTDKIRKKTAIIDISDKHKYKIYNYKHIYINPLEENEIKEIIAEIYKDNKEKEKTALSIFSESKNLMVRPVMLNYIDDIISSAINEKLYKLNSYQIYKFIVNAWLEREERNYKIIDNLKDKLYKIMLIFAKHAYLKYKKN